MLLTLTTTHRPATDLGFLLHKHPERAQRFELGFGAAHVFYPEASDARCTAALLLDVDPVALVRDARAEEAYVNDRPYVASSYLSVAISRVFGTALSGRAKSRPGLVDQPIPLEARVAMVPARGGEAIVRRLFEPLGYAVEVETHALDPQFPQWGDSRYVDLTLRADVRLTDLLSHLYVLIPALDAEKHYFIGADEVAKLLRHGEGWLAGHPDHELISRRYLERRRSLVAAALRRLEVDDGEDEPTTDDPATGDDVASVATPALERRRSLHAVRLEVVAGILAERPDVRRVLDLGCGEGKLLALLLENRQLDEIVGMDVSTRALEIAHRRLRVDQMHARQRERLTLLQGSLVYRDRRLEGFDAAAVVEVVEHLDPTRLEAFERCLFGFARPRRVVLTTPNRDHNALFETLEAGAMRHADHRFEWSRDELGQWARAVAARYDYRIVRVFAVGHDDQIHPELGAPTQGVVFERRAAEEVTP